MLAGQADEHARKHGEYIGLQEGDQQFQDIHEHAEQDGNDAHARIHPHTQFHGQEHHGHDAEAKSRTIREKGLVNRPIISIRGIRGMMFRNTGTSGQKISL